SRRQHLRLALRQVRGVEPLARDATGPRGEGIVAGRAAVGFEEAPPGVAARLAACGIVPLPETVVVLCLAGCQEELGGRPGEFVVVHELVAVVGDPLVGTVLPVARDR